MKTLVPFVLRTCLLGLCSAFLAACSGNNNNNKGDDSSGQAYSAEVVWTEYGIPHVMAQDWGSLGYGAGYAAAKENFCVIMRAYVTARGDTSRYFGGEGDLNHDFVFRLFNSDEAVERMIAQFPDFLRDNLEGYSAGMNRYLRETGVDNLAEGEEGCRGAPWVREVSIEDAVRLVHMLILAGSSDRLADFAVAARPAPAMARALPAGVSAAEHLVAALNAADLDQALGMPTRGELGSNAYAIGAEASQTNSGILLGNPHFPWQGNRRFFMFHLTMAGEYDVMGAALLGLPAPVIGFTRDVAWSHTVSTGSRFTFYELELNPDNPMQYLYDGELRDIEPRTVSVEQLQADGSVTTVEHTFYFSHFGPIVDLGAVNNLLAGWPNVLGTLLTYRDANLENLRVLEQWVRMGQAADLSEFKQALRPIGIPWVNTIAADRYGDAFYGDISANPHISVTQYNNCVRGALQTLLTQMGFPTFDGSDSACEWGSDPDTAEGIFGYDSLPKLETRQYGANANDSYWLPNPRHLLEGYSPIIGRERVPQSLRTRQTFDQAEKRLAGTDGLGEPGFNIDNIRAFHERADNYAAQLALADVVSLCRGVEDWSPYGGGEGISLAEEACNVLAGWDGRHRLESVGAQVFYEFWQRAAGTGNLWQVPFDPADPVNTPRQLNVADPAVADALLLALAAAAQRLADAGIPLDRPWGEVQFDEKNGERIGIHGGSGAMMFSVITSGLVDGEGYADIVHGNSYIQAVTWDESDCPDAWAVLTYSQSTDPASDHYADGTRLYSRNGWIDMPFCEPARDAAEIGRATLEE